MTTVTNTNTTTGASNRATKSVRRQRSMVKVVKDTVDRLAGGCHGAPKCGSTPPVLRRICSSIREKEGEEMWVCVNVAHKVTQYVCTLDLEA